MRVALFWVDLLHYHAARINASIDIAQQNGHEIFPIAIRPGAPQFPVSGYQHLLTGRCRVLTNNPQVGKMQSPISAKQLINVLEEINPDVVAIPGYDNRVALAALGWCRRNQRGAVLMTESQNKDFVRLPLKEWGKKILLTAFDAALVGGKAHSAYVNELGMPVDRIFTRYDVVDNEFWSSWTSNVQEEPEIWRKRLGFQEHFFLSACRLVPKKNIAGLIRAYAHYAAGEQAPWPLVIVGDGPLRGELENLTQSMGITHLVHFMGYLSADEMGPVYGLASVFVLASAYSEQWGLVVNEAMSAGLPVIVSKICGCVPDLVIDGVTGYSFDPTDENRLAYLLKLCSSGAINLSQIGCAAQKHIQSYSPHTFAENLIASAETAIAHAENRRINFWPFPLVLP